jgi:hypothetical protein
MRLTFIFIILSILFLETSCHKKPDSSDSQPIPPTIYPHSYFPIYPGSSWNYSWKDFSSNQTTYLTWNSSPNYQLYHYSEGNGKYSSYVYVPFLNNEPIYGYKKVLCGYWSSDVCYLYEFLSEDTSFSSYRQIGNPETGTTFLHTIMFDKTIDNSNDSIIILMSTFENGYPQTNWSIYKKNVGLIQYFEMNMLTNDTIREQRLLSYSINFPRK